MVCVQCWGSGDTWIWISRPCVDNNDVAWPEKLSSVGTPHPRGPSAGSPLFSQMRKDVWDYSHRRNLNPWLPACWWGHGSQWECLWNPCTITTNRRQDIGVEGGGSRRGNETGREARGVDDSLMWEWRDHPAPVSCEPEAVPRAQHVFVLWRGLSSLLKKICKGGWLGYESYTARKISPNCWERSHLTEFCFSLITYVPFSDCEAMHGAKIEFYSFICGLREEAGQNTPRLIMFLPIKMKPCGDCLLSFET